jgi:hypothetical protein
MILRRMALFAPYPCSIALLQYDNPPVEETRMNYLQESEDSIPTVEELIKAKAQKTDRYRVILAINSPEFHYTIPLNKSMPPDTIFYHSALFRKPLSGDYQMKIDRKKVKFEVDVTPLPGSSSKETFPTLLAFFKEI